MKRSYEGVSQSDDVVRAVDSAYQRPTLTLIGNLNDLLAGTASKDQDTGVSMPCAGTGDDIAECD